MTESYKFKSKLATAISFIAALIAYLGKDGLTELMPKEYAYLIPILVFVAAYILAQSTENKRVKIAEQLVHEQYNPTIDETEISYNEQIVGEEDGT